MSGVGGRGNLSGHWVDGVFGRRLGAPRADAEYDSSTGTTLGAKLRERHCGAIQCQDQQGVHQLGGSRVTTTSSSGFQTFNTVML